MSHSSKRVTWREALEDKFQSDEESVLAVEEGEVSSGEDDDDADDDEVDDDADDDSY